MKMKECIIILSKEIMALEEKLAHANYEISILQDEREELKNTS